MKNGENCVVSFELPTGFGFLRPYAVTKKLIIQWNGELTKRNKPPLSGSLEVVFREEIVSNGDGGQLPTRVSFTVQGKGTLVATESLQGLARFLKEKLNLDSLPAIS